jgi:hypothetical protein
MINQTQANNFLTKGYAHFHENNLIDLSIFKITNVEIKGDLKNNFTFEEKILLEYFVNYISENYVSTLYNNFEVTYYSVWNGVHEGSTKWHNDSDEGFNFGVNYYHDNTDENIGGSVEFRYPGGEDTVYPKSGDLIFINQNKNFLHKANRSKSSRRVASIEYKVYE